MNYFPSFPPAAILTLTFCTSSAHALQPLSTENLSSDTAWTLSVDGGPARSIKVPGGGYNSDLQQPPFIDQKSVTESVVYRRSITIPNVRPDQATLLEFGAVNFGAEVYLSGADGTGELLVGSHTGPLLPFSLNLTPFVSPGGMYQLKVKAYTGSHYGNKMPVGFVYEEVWKSPVNGWGSRFGQGITKFVQLAIYPPVAVTDVFVKPSVTNQQLSSEVTLTNYSPTARSVELAVVVSSWNQTAWTYPFISPRQVTLPAGGSLQVALGPLPWTLGPGSYWWPNKPFHENYVPQLHLLTLLVTEGGTALHQASQRFGFVEWAEGPTYYTVNGVRINFLGDGTPESGMSDYDAYSTSPAFLPPTGPGTGCVETWKRYMRMGIFSNRTHQSTPTRHMLEAADEIGFTLIPETAIRGSAAQQVWDAPLLTQAVRELGRYCRNHPSVCRYSLENEYDASVVPGWPAFIGTLADAMVEVDPTRPLVFENDKLGGTPTTFYGTNSGKPVHLMMHYVDHPRPAQSITGLGECAWSMSDIANTGLQQFALLAADGRREGIAYYAGWDWLNYWPNFLEGMTASRHAWKQPGNSHPDRMDGVNGWGSPLIIYAKRMFHPFLVLDFAFHKSNGIYGNGWPSFVPSYSSGSSITRTLEIFNDSLETRDLTLLWSARWDSPYGPEAASGSLPIMGVPPGTFVRRGVTFTAPSTPDTRTLHWVIRSMGEEGLLFEDDSLRFEIAATQNEALQIAYIVPNATVGAQAWTEGLGMDFEVHRHIVVEKLGVFDSGGDGIAGNNALTAQLFSRSGGAGQLLVTLTFSSTSAGTLQGGTRFKTLSPPLVLEPGSYSIAAYGFGNANKNGNSSQQTKTWSTNPGNGLISFSGLARYGGTPGTLPPTPDDGPADRYAAGSFQYRALTEIAGSYNPWITAAFPGESNSEVVGILADPDTDGQANLLEFASAGNPAQNDVPHGPWVTPTDDGCLITAILPAGVPEFSGTTSLLAVSDGVAYLIEGSENLVDYDLRVTETLPPADPQWQVVPEGYAARSFQIQLTGSAGRGFVRLRLQPAP